MINVSNQVRSKPEDTLSEVKHTIQISGISDITPAMSKLPVDSCNKRCMEFFPTSNAYVVVSTAIYLHHLF